jgi:Zn-dependent metalloprotease/transcriptional regulator CtsR
MKRGSLLPGLLVAALPCASWAAEAHSTRQRYALTGQAAADFQIPADMTPQRTLPLRAAGLVAERYQQRFGPAAVLGGQLTVLRGEARARRALAAIGARHVDITPANAVRLTADEARAISARDAGAGRQAVELLIDPRSGLFFYRVETRRPFERWFHWVDADTGRILRKYDGRETDHGIGVKGDIKSLAGLDGQPGTADDITKFHSVAGHGASGPHWDLFSADGRHNTYDALNGIFFAWPTTDFDNHWTLVTPDRTSPGQPAMVDAQYYGQVTDGYYLARHGLDWVADCGYPDMTAVVHYDQDYVNAFWGGEYMVYGDGDGFIAREFSGALDVVAHENTHGLTQCTSNLVYQDESGALNESFSDMLGTAAEFWADQNGLDPAVAPDWYIGEDVYLLSEHGFRNMSDPEENFDPDHYSERYVGPDDNGGVHTNSLIPNHAFYLLVNGGSNAGEAEGHPHTGPAVTGIGMAAAERIVFVAFTTLAEDASMCDARAATEAAAETLYGPGSQERLSTTDAWLAVGLTDVACGLAPPAAPTNLTAAPASSSRINLAWTDNAIDEEGFKVERSTDGASFAEVATLAANAEAWTDTGLLAETTYTYRVRAFGGPFFSDYTNDASATTLATPAAPSGLTATAVSSGRINLAWADNSTYEQGFKVERSTDGATFTEIASVGANVTAYVSLGLAGSTTYHYRVRAFDGPNLSGYSNVASATTLPVPGAPTGLLATAVSSSRINLAWTDNATTETGYRVERSADGAAFTVVATLPANATVWSNVNLPASTPFWYRVLANDGYNDSAPSNVASATTLPAPAAPGGLTAVAVSSSRIDLAWTDNSAYEQGFKVERSTDGVTFVQAGVLGANTTSWSSTGLVAGTTYTHRLRAYDGPNDSAPSNAAAAATLPPPAAPTGLTATAVSPSRIDLAWTDTSTYEQGFKVERSTGGGPFSQVTVVGANVTTWSNTSLVTGTAYTYRVRAYDGPNASAYSDTATATPLPAPAAPSNLQAVPFSSSRIDLTWTDNAGNEQGFKVERSTGGGTFTLVAVVGANVTGYANPGLVTGTTYTYRVKAYDGPNESDPSNTATATTLAPPAAPTGLAATPVTSTRIDLQWIDNATYEQGYRVERAIGGGGFAQVAALGANATSWSSTSLVSGTTYSYRVKAYDGGNESAYSNTVSATPLPPPAAPSALTATPVSSSRIDLLWTDNATYEQGFKVERSTDGVTFAQIAVLGVNAAAYSSTGLLAGQAYTFRVRAYEGANDSAYSNAASATTTAAPAAPSNLSATPVTSSRIDLLWTDNASNEQGFKVERSTDGANFSQVALLGVNATAWSNTGLATGGTYTYRVRSYNGPNDSAPSNTATAAPLPAPNAPGNLVATPISGSRIDLAWTDTSAYEQGFKVERSTDGTTFTQIATVGANVTTYSSTSLASGTTYTFRVRAYDGPNDSAWSNTASATTSSAPAAPSNLAATPVSPSRIDLAWTDNSATEQGFKVERSTGGAWSVIATVGSNVTSYANTSLISGTVYSYRVKAYDGPNESAYSNIASATPLPPPAAPSGLLATPFSSSRIDLLWTDNASNEQGFKVERSLDGVNFVLLAVIGANTTGYSATSLTAGTTYAFRVRAYEGPNESAPSNTAAATTLPPPAAPTGLTATAVSSSRIDLAWTDNATYEQGFKIERATGGGAFTQIGTMGAGATAFSNIGLAPGTTYTYRVRAFDGSNNSGYSNTASATTP